MEKSDKPILITGAHGQLGSEILAIKNKFPFRIIGTDVSDFDITDTAQVEEIIERYNPQVIVNCAAYTAVDKAESDSQRAKILNSDAPGKIAKTAIKKGCKFIHISTDYVFDGEGTKPYTENERLNPQSVYGKTKLAGEQNVLSSNADSIIIRTSWLYSVYGNNFVKTMLRLGAERESIGVVSDQVGCPTNAADLALFILKIVQKFQNENYWKPGIYHYSNNGVCSWYEFATEIMNLAKLSCKVNPISTEEYPLPAPRPKYSVLSMEKTIKVFGINIPEWKESLAKCVSILSAE